MKVPSNIIQTDKYTSGNEFVEEKTNKPYQGYYYELNGSLYTGKEYSIDAIKIIKKQDQNQLYNSSNTALFSLVSGITSQQLIPAVVKGIPFSDDSPHGEDLSFYSRQLNINPIIIKSLDEKTYISLQGNPLYKTTFIGNYNGVNQNLDQADTQIPGLKTFLGG
jgi:hypothetical protein